MLNYLLREWENTDMLLQHHDDAEIVAMMEWVRMVCPDFQHCKIELKFAIVDMISYVETFSSCAVRNFRRKDLLDLLVNWE